jgi:hypothetical protein
VNSRRRPQKLESNFSEKTSRPSQKPKFILNIESVEKKRKKK